MNKIQKMLTFAIIGTMMMGISGCDSKTELEHDLDAVREKIEENKKKNAGSNPADYELPTIRPDVLPSSKPDKTEKPEKTARPTQTAKPTYSVRPTYSMKPAQTNVPTATNKPAQTNKPSTTVKPVPGGKLPLDTTGNFTGLELERGADRNDHTGYRIKNSKTNKVSSMTGSEPQLRVAVNAFNNFKKDHDNFVAYKVIEFDTYSDADIKKMNKAISGEKGEEFWRITMNIYQYQESSFGSPYENNEDDPYYFVVSIYKTASGEYKEFTHASMR